MRVFRYRTEIVVRVYRNDVKREVKGTTTCLMPEDIAVLCDPSGRRYCSDTDVCAELLRNQHADEGEYWPGLEGEG